jgi:hypothetical protein
LLLAAGVDIALVSKLLGHSSIGLTVDTYSHLLEGVGKEAAERATALVPRKRPADPRDQSVTNPAPESSDSPRQNDGGPGNTALLTDLWVGSAWEGGSVAAEAEHGECDQCWRRSEPECDSGE